MTERKTAPPPRYYVDADDFSLERKTAYLTQKEAAKYLGVTPRTIRNWESGRYRIPYAAFKLVRMRAGGIVHAPGWDGWRYGRDGALFGPDGRSFKSWELYNIRHVFSMAEHFRKQVITARTDVTRALADGTDELATRPLLRVVGGAA